MTRPKGSKNKPKVMQVKAPEANGMNGKAPLTETEIAEIKQATSIVESQEKPVESSTIAESKQEGNNAPAN